MRTNESQQNISTNNKTKNQKLYQAKETYADNNPKLSLESLDAEEEVSAALQVGTQKDFAKALSELIKLEGSTIEGYKLAIKHVEDTEHKEALTLFLDQHNQHLNNLIAIAKNNKIDCLTTVEDFEKIFFAKMSVLVGELIITEGDRPILQMLLNNEKDTNIAYERISSRQDIWPDAKELLQKAYKDEKNHQKQLIAMLAL